MSKYIVILLVCLFLLYGCSTIVSPDSAQEAQSTPASGTSQEMIPTPTPVPSIGGWYEYSYSTQDYLQTTYTVYLDVNDGIEVKAGLHTWNDNAMHEHYCVNISRDTIIVNYPDATHVSLGITLDGYYSNETYTLDRGGFLTRRYVDAEGHIQLSVLSPTTEESYNSAIAALHTKAPDCTGSDF